MTSAYLGDSGIVLSGPADSDGVTWRWNGDDPWSPSPAPRDVTGDNATDHGSWDATQFYGPRSLALEGHAHGTHDALHRAKHRLFAACGLGFTFRVIEPGFDRQARVRRNGEILWTELSAHENGAVARFSVPLWAGDPRIYSTAIQSASTSFPTSTGGLSLPATVPFLLDAVSSSGDMNMVNAGNETAWPIYRIDPSGTDPVVDPVIVDTATGRAMRFALTIGPGEWLTIDTDTHEVLGNGDPDASRRNAFHGDWFGLAPGNNTVRYSGAFGVGSTLSAQWRHTDI